MRVLIVGCGYIGLALGKHLAGQGHTVFGLRRSGSPTEPLRTAGIEPLAGDVTSPAGLVALPTPFDWVVNCVAASSSGADEYRRVYLEGTRNLLERFAAEPPRVFIYTSSTGVYGQVDGSLVTESSLTSPGTPTGEVLVETEQALRSAVHERGFPAIILRLAGIYGPARGYWLRQFLAGEARIEGEGRRLLNMIHQEDVVGAAVAVLERGRPGEIYNVVDDEPVSQIEVFRWLADRLGRPMPPSVPEDAAVSRRRGLTSKRVSNRKLRTGLDWNLRYPTFREGYAAELERLGMAGSREL